LGYDTYNALNGGVNSTITLAQAKAMSKLGLVDAGYNIYILDDFYLEPHRDAKGNLKVNTTLFPGGMKHWTNQVNKYNISVGAYSSNGLRTCAGNPYVVPRRLASS
jgi:alpha-galactosidase